MATSETTAIAITKRKEEPLFIIKWWNNLSDFLHQARLIPFIIAVSGYHYFQVLKTHDEVFTAWPVAIFLDLLHYRTVQQAVETRKPLWGVAAVLTTAVAYAFQFIFYSGTGHSGEYLPVWQQFLFASVVPIGIAFMVWHHHENGQKVESGLQEELIKSQEDAEGLQAKVDALENQVKEQSVAIAEGHAAVSKGEADTKRLQRLNEESQTHAGRLQNQIEDLQAKITSLQGEFAALQQIELLWQQLNRQTQYAAKVNMGLVTIVDAAKELEISTDTVRRTMKRINGHVSSNPNNSGKRKGAG